MGSTLWFQTWFLFIVLYCFCGPQCCTTSTVIYDYFELNEPDGTSDNGPQTQLWLVDKKSRLMDTLNKRIPPHLALHHRENRRVRHKQHRYEQAEKSKRRWRAGEILERLNQLVDQRKSYAKNRLKNMRFGVSRKRSASMDVWDQLTY